MVVSYKECLKNHAASLGGHALDGCGEFMPSSNATLNDPTSLKCAACGCHRNFHRRDPPPPFGALQWSSSPSSSPSTNPISPDPASPPQQQQTPTVTSPTPCSYYPSMLLALSTGYPGPSDEYHQHQSNLNHAVTAKREQLENPSIRRKRSRTKFSQEQKQKMVVFAEKIGWRLNKGEEKMVEDFCNEVGLSRRVFKVWMHNNKHNFLKKESNNDNSTNTNNQNNNNNDHEEDEDEDEEEEEEEDGVNGFRINVSAKSQD